MKFSMHLIATAILLICSGLYATAQDLQSPDGRITVKFSLRTEDPATGDEYPADSPFYEVIYDGKQFLQPSHMGFDIAGTAEIKHYFKVDNCSYRENRNTWKPVYGEQETYPDNYNEMRVTLKETLYPERTLDIVFRAFNEGIAFRYELPAQKGLENVVLTAENTEFSFPKFSSVWESHGHEGKYYKLYPKEIRPGCELPLTCMTQSGVYGAIMEASCFHYPRAYVEAPYDNANVLRIQLRGEAKGHGGITTCWRVISMSDNPGDLTPGFGRKTLQTTFAHRLALAVIYYSPAQFLFWNEKITEEHSRPELEFRKNLPTTWDQTEFLSGDIGESAVVARRKGNTWYIGGITNTNARNIGVDLEFLGKGRHTASIYTDNEDGSVSITTKTVTASTHLDFNLMPSGGFDIKIVPAKSVAFSGPSSRPS